MRQDAVPAFTLLVIALAACGGKIAEDPGNLGEPGSRSTSPSPSSPVLPAPTTASAPSELSVEAVCSTICDRNGRCGADPGGCAERCTSSLTVGACAPSADASLRCWVANLEPGCSELPPACEDAYCTYTRCAGIASPPYCR